MLVSIVLAGKSLETVSAGTIIQNKSVWEGFYEFSEDGGRTAGGTPILVEHLITIYQENNSLLAELTSNGYQTARNLVGEVRVEGNRARIHFRSYGDVNTFKAYEAGQLLLTLVRSGTRGKARILTYWGAFQPAVQPLRSGRVYFKKGRNP
jgi:hypothetical protein